MSRIVIYTTPVCPRCKLLKSLLDELMVEYEEKNMLDLDVQTELIMMDIYTSSAPILRVRDRFLTVKELFPNGELDRRLVIRLLGGGEHG